tara:strand:- start:980 stop:1354 length:375 start_codon:yes stop_codon:yes gene_type:complete
MANRGISKYTVQESQNIQLGQCRSAQLDSANEYICNGGVVGAVTGNVVVAITVVQDCKFQTLTAENKDYCIGTNATDGTYNDTGCGDVINSGATGTVFPAGITIYGRWTNVDLASGVVILYINK